jgi:hypothetical protein
MSVVELSDGTFFVLETPKVHRTLEGLMKGCNKKWSKGGKPVRLMDSFVDADGITVNQQVETMMEIHGESKVRGGKYSRKKRKVAHPELLCTKCQRVGHEEHKCFSRITVDGKVLIQPTPDVQCERCGRQGHLTEKCFAKKHLDGHSLITTTVVDPLPPVATPDHSVYIETCNSEEDDV